MTQTETPAKKSPIERRLDFVKSTTDVFTEKHYAREVLKNAGLAESLVPDLTVEELTAIAERMSTEGPSWGKTTRWHVACQFAIGEIRSAEEQGTLDFSLARWAVVQGSVFMGHAAE